MMNFSDRRQYRRTDAVFSATVVNALGAPLGVRLSNLSLGGMMLEGDNSVLSHLEVQNPNTGEPIFPVEVTVRLQANGDERDIGINARLIYKRRLSQKEFQFGFVTIGYEGDGRNRLLSHLRTRPGAD